VPYERLVNFVDDLDRLSAEEMVLGFDAVRTFMEIPIEKLPKNAGLVAVPARDGLALMNGMGLKDKGDSKAPPSPATLAHQTSHDANTAND